MAGKYEDAPGFCKSATLDEIRAHDHVLTPGRYVGAEELEEDDEPFEERMTRLAANLRSQMDLSTQLGMLIDAALDEFGYGS